MATEFGTGKTVFVLAIVAGCFAVLWPKLFSPMLEASLYSKPPMDNSAGHLRQERPPHPHLRPDRLHPALRERGRAIPPIPQSHVVPRIVEREGRPGPIPGMRPPMGGAGHVVPPPKGSGTMGIVMPLYTIGIIIFFVYTMMKLLFKKSEEAESIKNFQSDPEFRRVVFHERSSDKNGTGSVIRGKGIRPYEEHTKLVETAISGLLAEVDQQRENLGVRFSKGENGHAAENRIEEEEPEVAENEPPGMQVVNMEMRASCEGGKPWPGSQPATPPTQRSRSASRPGTPSGAATPPVEAQAIYLEGALPPASQVLVADSETQAVKAEDKNEETTSNDPAVILSGKMTLSLISLDPADLDAADAAREAAGTPSRSRDEDEEAVEKLEAEKKEVEKEKVEGGGGPPPKEPADKEPVTASGDVTNTLVSTEVAAEVSSPVTSTEKTETSQVGGDETGESGGGVERRQEEEENEEETPEHLRPPPLLSLDRIADIEKERRKISFGGIEDEEGDNLPTYTELDAKIARAMRSEIENNVRQQIEDIIEQAVNCVFSAQSDEEEEEEEGEEEEEEEDEEVRKAFASEPKKPIGHAISKVVTSGIVDPEAVSVSKITLVSPPSESEEEEEEEEEEVEVEEEETDEEVPVASSQRVPSASRPSSEANQRQESAKPAQNGSVKIAPTGKVAEEESEEEEEVEEEELEEEELEEEED